MKLETLKWIYQRLSTPFILVLFSWLIYKVYNIKKFDFETFNIFFENYLNLYFFLLLIILTLIHTSIEVFHAINDYFSETKNEKIIRNLTNFLYLIMFLSILFFLFKFVL